MTETPAPPPPPPTPMPADEEEDLLFPSRMPHMGSFTRVVSPGASMDGKPKAKSASGGPKKSGGGLKASNVLIFALWGTAALGLVTFAARKELVRAMAQSWLTSQRVASELKIDEVSFGRVKGSAKLGGIGPGANVPPDVSLKQFDIDFSLNLFAGKGRPLARLKSVRLDGVEAAFAYKAGKLNFGALDAMVQKALKTPGNPEDAPERLEINGLSLKVATDYGKVTATGGLRLTKGQVENLALSVPKTVLHGPNGGGQINSGRLRVTTLKGKTGKSERHLEADFDAQRFDLNLEDERDSADKSSDFSLESLTLSLRSDLPAGTDLLPSGPIKASLDLKAGTVQTPDALLKGVATKLDFDGRLTQTRNLTKIEGRSNLTGQIDRLRSADMSAQKLNLHSQEVAGLATLITAKPLSPLQLSLDGPVVFDAGQVQQGAGLSLSSGHVALSRFAFKLDESGMGGQFEGQGRFKSLKASDLTLTSVATKFKGAAHADSSQAVADSLGTPHAAWDVNFTADVSSAEGRYTGLTEAARKSSTAPKDAPNDAPKDVIVALDQAGRRFSLDVKGLGVNMAGSGPFDGHADQLKVDLKSKAIITPATGGVIEITSVDGQPIVSSQQKGALDLKVSGGDLPTVSASLRQILMSPQSGAISAKYDINALFTQTPIREATLKAHGDLLSRDGATQINLAECASLEANEAIIGSRLTALKGAICQGVDPVLTLEGAAWSARGIFKDFAADVPESEVRAASANGQFNAQSLASGGLAFDATLKDVVVSDALAAARFNPLSFAGQVSQTAKALTGSFKARVKNEAAYARNSKSIVVIDIKGDVATSSGHIAIHANELDFTPEGLQPLDLSPMVSGVATSNVTGSVAFDGFMDYGPETTTSGGMLKLKAIDFTGPLGEGKNLNSAIEFTSLTPLLSKPDQAMTLDEFRAILTFTQMKTAMEFKSDRVSLARSEGLSPGGTVVLEPMDVPLDNKGEIRGALLFDGLDFGAVIEKTELAKDIDFTGKLTGKVPFWIGNIDGVQRLRFNQGQLRNDGPGRISLNPAVLTSVEGGGADIAKEKGDKIEGGSLADPTGFYRQAMSNIAFDEISVDINSRTDGVVEPKFHIKGQFDPPQKQEARINFGDLISGKWQQKTIDLPSGTPIDLTIETPFNLDQILDDLMRSDMPATPPAKAKEAAQ